MEANIQIFNNSQFGEIRTSVSADNEPLFCLADVCKAIGLANNRNVKTRLDEDDVHLLDTIDSLGRNQLTTFVTESGMYNVILRSDSPQAKPFRKWVTSEVLPSIRKSGGYITSMETDTPEVIMARALQVANETLQRHKQRVQMLEGQTEIQREQIKELAPKAQYTDEVLQSTSTYTLTQVAHDLGLRSVHVLTDILKRKGLLYHQSNQWQPTAKVADKSFFATRTAKYIKKDNTIGSSISTVVTERGRVFIHNLIRKESVL